MIDPNLYRIIKIKQAAVAVGIIFIPLLIWGYFFDDKIVSTTRDTGIVIEVSSRRSTNSITYFGKVKTLKGVIVQICFGDQMPSKGESIPLIVMTLGSGKKDYNLDFARWP